MVIYKTTNLVNGKQYIGKDAKNTPSYLGSGTFLKKAIQKYGKENFKKEILEVCSSQEELKEREEYWLNYYDAGNNPDFYNTHNHSYGGILGQVHSEETRNKISESHIGMKYSDEYKKKLSSIRLGKKLKPHTEETKKKMSESKIGKERSQETKDKISKSLSNRPSNFSGKTHSNETKQKLKEKNSGKNNPNFGKKRSEETRKKMSESHRKKKSINE